MAIDKAVDSTQLNNGLTSVANAIRTKGGTSAQLAFPNGFVSAVNDIQTGGNEFVITLTKNATTGYWEPDKTLAEIQTANQAGKTIGLLAYGDYPCYFAGLSSEAFDYAVDEPNFEEFYYEEKAYTLLSNGDIRAQYTIRFYYPQDADSVASDVAQGKIFYTSTGRAVGTATPSTPTIQSLTVTPTTSQQTFNASGVDGYKPVIVNAMPSGTAGTPTATKGTVSNHSVSVTPSVTNTTGYITGSTKTGTAVTVSASELVSGSETKTANGTYDVTNLAELIVNVAGGGGSGLEYETGTYTPTSDNTRLTITFANSHSEAPVFVLFSDQTGTAHSTTSSNYNFMYCDFYKLWGHGIPYSTSAFRYAAAYYSYRGNSTSTISSSATLCSENSDSTSESDSSYPRFWASPTEFRPYSNSSRYWRSGRTYKWIAVWKPTS